MEETKDLAGILNAGALPVQLEEIYSTSVGAQFGEQALNKTILAGIIGVSLIFIFHGPVLPLTRPYRSYYTIRLYLLNLSRLYRH